MTRRVPRILRDIPFMLGNTVLAQATLDRRGFPMSFAEMRKAELMSLLHYFQECAISVRPGKTLQECTVALLGSHKISHIVSRLCQERYGLGEMNSIDFRQVGLPKLMHKEECGS